MRSAPGRPCVVNSLPSCFALCFLITPEATLLHQTIDCCSFTTYLRIASWKLHELLTVYR